MGQFPEFGNELVSWPFLCVCVCLFIQSLWEGCVWVGECFLEVFSFRRVGSEKSPGWFVLKRWAKLLNLRIRTGYALDA